MYLLFGNYNVKISLIGNTVNKGGFLWILYGLILLKV